MSIIMLGIFLLIMFGLYIFELASLGKVFDKAGLPVWAILVPYYNTYLLYKAVWSKKAALYILIINIVITIVGFTAVVALFQYGIQSHLALNGANSWATTFIVCVILFAILACLLWIQGIIQGLYMALSFGQNWIFALGLVFLPVLFIPQLAFMTDAIYIGSAADNSLSIKKIAGLKKKA